MQIKIGIKRKLVFFEVVWPHEYRVNINVKSFLKAEAV
jgi:hypothetical protein